MNHVAEIALQGAHCFLFALAPSTGIGVDVLSAGFATKLCHGHEMKNLVEPSVSTTVEAMADGLSRTFRRRRRQRRRPVEASEAALGEPPWVTNFYQDLSDAARRKTCELRKRRPAALDEFRQVPGRLLIARIELGDLLRSTSEQLEPDGGGPI